MIARIRVLYRALAIKSQVWTIFYCLGLGHEIMVHSVCLSMLLLNHITILIIYRNHMCHSMCVINQLRLSRVFQNGRKFSQQTNRQWMKTHSQIESNLPNSYNYDICPQWRWGQTRILSSKNKDKVFLFFVRVIRLRFTEVSCYDLKYFVVVIPYVLSIVRKHLFYL